MRFFTRAAGSPLVRGGVVLMGGVLTGNVLGFLRVALTAYLLGTHSQADSLAVAMGPFDTLTSVLINGIVFAFVPMLTACAPAERTALFLKVSRCFAWALAVFSAVVLVAAPWLMRALAPGIDPRYFGAAVLNLRIMMASTAPAGVAGVHFAQLYTDRRFAPAAFYQATLNICTIVSAICLWKALGVYAFSIGYSAGVWVQLGVVWFAVRRRMDTSNLPRCEAGRGGILAKPAFYGVYAAGIGLNLIFTRAWATHTGPGMAAALDYCLRGVSVPLAILVTPVANSLLPELARLRGAFRIREAIRLIDRTVGITALAAVAGCAVALVFRQPVIALLFQRGSFTAESTRVVSEVFEGLCPSLIGWSLVEVTSRSMFALDHPWPPVIAAAIPVILNVAITLRLHTTRPELIGLGATLGYLAGAAALFVMAHINRRRWSEGK